MTETNGCAEAEVESNGNGNRVSWRFSPWVKGSALATAGVAAITGIVTSGEGGMLVERILGPLGALAFALLACGWLISELRLQQRESRAALAKKDKQHQEEIARLEAEAARLEVAHEAEVARLETAHEDKRAKLREAIREESARADAAHAKEVERFATRVKELEQMQQDLYEGTLTRSEKFMREAAAFRSAIDKLSDAVERGRSGAEAT